MDDLHAWPSGILRVCSLHGQEAKIHSSRRRYSRGESGRANATSSPAAIQIRIATPRLHEDVPPAKIINYQLVAELEKRGISSIDARDILASLPPDQSVLDQLEWGDYQVIQARGKIANPAGFYISLLQRNDNPPPTFETSTARNARQRAESEQQEALQRETEAQLAAEAAAEAELDQLKAAQPERYQALYAPGPGPAGRGPSQDCRLPPRPSRQ